MSNLAALAIVIAIFTGFTSAELLRRSADMEAVVVFLMGSSLAVLLGTQE